MRRAARAVDTAFKSIDAARSSREFQDKNLDAEKKSYENGLSTAFQITQIQDQLTQARSDEVTATVNYRTALAEYYRSVGRLLEQQGVALEDPEEPDSSSTASASAARRCLERFGKAMAALEDSSFGRLFGVLFSPGKTFRSIAGRPTWGVALVVLVLSAALVALISGKRTDYRDMITQQHPGERPGRPPRLARARHQDDGEGRPDLGAVAAPSSWSLCR